MGYTGIEPVFLRPVMAVLIPNKADTPNKWLSSVSYNKLNNLVVERDMLPYSLAMSFFNLHSPRNVLSTAMLHPRAPGLDLNRRPDAYRAPALTI